jgi:tetratricopeptide (TPR) repeat protein
MGNFYQTVGELRQAIEAYQQAIELARTMNDRREEAFLSWNLGLLLVETDPARAVELMLVCVTYEREIDHPDAEADAVYVAGLEAGQ